MIFIEKLVSSFSIMLNLNPSENDPNKIDTFKETELVDNFTRILRLSRENLM